MMSNNHKIIVSFLLFTASILQAKIEYYTMPENYNLKVDKDKVTIEYNCGGYGNFVKNKKHVLEDKSIVKSGKCKHIIDNYKTDNDLKDIKKDIDNMGSVLENDF